MQPPCGSTPAVPSAATAHGAAQQPAAARDTAQCTGNISILMHPPLALWRVGSACCCAFGVVCTTMEASSTTTNVRYVASCKDHTADTSMLNRQLSLCQTMHAMCALCQAERHAQLQALYSERLFGALKLNTGCLGHICCAVIPTHQLPQCICTLWALCRATPTTAHCTSALQTDK